MSILIKGMEMPTEGLVLIRIEDRIYCRNCFYRAHGAHGGDQPWLCEYILITGKPRGCRAGEGCTKREEERNTGRPKNGK